MVDASMVATNRTSVAIDFSTESIFGSHFRSSPLGTFSMDCGVVTSTGSRNCTEQTFFTVLKACSKAIGCFGDDRQPNEESAVQKPPGLFIIGGYRGLEITTVMIRHNSLPEQCSDFRVLDFETKNPYSLNEKGLLRGF